MRDDDDDDDDGGLRARAVCEGLYFTCCLRHPLCESGLIINEIIGNSKNTGDGSLRKIISSGNTFGTC